MIEINNLSKSYGINKIFENESITLTNSCIYALVGVNGIGKSTFLNSIIQPSTLDKGSVKIDDIPSTDFTAKYHYAFVPDTKDMFLNLTGKEYLQFVATVYKGNIIKNLIMDCQSYTKYRPNETTGGIFVSWRRKEELPTGA